MGYVELHARSAFSFLRGGAAPEDLARTAAGCGLAAAALCDRNGVHGAVRFHGTGIEAGLRPLVGAELVLEDEGGVAPGGRPELSVLRRLSRDGESQYHLNRVPVRRLDVHEVLAELEPHPALRPLAIEVAYLSRAGWAVHAQRVDPVYIEDRLNQMQQSITLLTGQLEQMQYKNQQLQQQQSL